MKTVLKVLSWVFIVLGGLAILASSGDYYAFVGSVLYITEGTIALLYIKEVEYKEIKKN